MRLDSGSRVTSNDDSRGCMHMCSAIDNQRADNEADLGGQEKRDWKKDWREKRGKGRKTMEEII